MWLLVFIVVNFCSIFFGLIAGKQIKTFLKKHKSIANEQTLEEFKFLVRCQMYLVYFLLFFLIIGFFLNIVVVLNHGLFGLTVTLLIYAYSFWQSQYFRRLEKKARYLNAANEILARKYYLVSYTWANKPLPDF